MSAATPDLYLYQHRGPVDLYLGDATDVLATLPDSTVDCCVTSPPYWGSHRDYGTGTWHGGDPTCGHMARRVPSGTVCPACGAGFVDPQYGLETTVEEYVDRL